MLVPTAGADIDLIVERVERARAKSRDGFDGVYSRNMTDADLSAAGVALVVALVTSMGAYLIQHAKLRQELKSDLMAEAAIHRLLKHKRFVRRSFKHISHRIAGFDDDELRRKLVRAGAVRFNDQAGNEFWGLISRNRRSIDIPDETQEAEVDRAKPAEN